MKGQCEMSERARRRCSLNDVCSVQIAPNRFRPSFSSRWCLVILKWREDGRVFCNQFNMILTIPPPPGYCCLSLNEMQSASSVMQLLISMSQSGRRSFFLCRLCSNLTVTLLCNMSASIQSPPNFLSRTPYQSFNYSSSIAILFLLYMSYNHILYQLAFLTPGSWPASACILNWYLPILKARKTPFEIPPSTHRLLICVGLEYACMLANSSCAFVRMACGRAVFRITYRKACLWQ